MGGIARPDDGGAGSVKPAAGMTGWFIWSGATQLSARMTAAPAAIASIPGLAEARRHERGGAESGEHGEEHRDEHQEPRRHAKTVEPGQVVEQPLIRARTQVAPERLHPRAEGEERRRADRDDEEAERRAGRGAVATPRQAASDEKPASDQKAIGQRLRGVLMHRRCY